MSDLNADFPQSANTKKYFKAEDFQDKEVTLNYLGWKKKPNEDTKTMSWKDRLKYVMRYSYPQFALDEAGEKKLNEDGTPWQNGNWDPLYPKCWFVVYVFEEGEFDNGIFPLWKLFRKMNPKPGDQVTIGKTGTMKDTVWTMKVNEFKQF